MGVTETKTWLSLISESPGMTSFQVEMVPREAATTVISFGSGVAQPAAPSNRRADTAEAAIRIGGFCAESYKIDA